MDSIEQLFAEVYENPEDDQLRRVLSDALLAINDPRGELILYQLEPDKDDYRYRAMRLIQAHGLTWLGPLRGKVIPLAYERGFLAAAHLLSETKDADYDHPIWSTVHTLDLEALDEVELLEVRITPAMRSLKFVIGLSADGKETLRKRNKAVDDLQVILALEALDAEDRYDLADE